MHKGNNLNFTFVYILLNLYFCFIFVHFIRFICTIACKICNLFKIILKLQAQTIFIHGMKVKVKLLSHVQLFATPQTVAYQAPASMGFSRQEYWSGLQFPSPGDFPNSGTKPGCPTLWTDALPSEPPGKPIIMESVVHKFQVTELDHRPLKWNLFFCVSSS